MVPNYSCRDHDKLSGIIGDQTSESSLHVFEILNLYGYTQISYGATDPLLTNKHIYPSFFQTLPNDQTQYLAIVKLLKHFGWTWIGIITSQDDGGEKRSQELKRVAAVYDICVEYIIPVVIEGFVEKSEMLIKKIEIFNKSSSKIVVLCSITFSTMMFIKLAGNSHHDKTFILPAGPIVHYMLASKFKTLLHGSLVFAPLTKKIPHLKRFLDNISIVNHPNDLLLEHILAVYFNCLTSNQILNFVIKSQYEIVLHPCNSSIKISQLGNNLYNTEWFDTAYHVYKAVYAMAHSFHEMQLYMSRHPGNSYPVGHKAMRKVPVSRCSEECPDGYRRAMMKGIHRCCFSCVQCLDGEISNKTDKGLCMKCPDDQWPNDKNQCAPKPTDFLSYSNDPIAIVASVISIIHFAQTLIILVIFIVYRDTPIIKANNQNLSFLILIFIMLNFLCVFLYIGRPVHATCLLRHTSYGIICSVTMSCILAKTIMVYLAFKATKPGSCWKKCIQRKWTYNFVFILSFFHVLICLIWLSISPPFPEMNTQSSLGKIIIQCNEGSMAAFSIFLGYMGLLAAVTFFVAFLARNLPDSFNEAKYITFSMLVFCSVWVAFIPAYMSVTGKNTVLVAIFAILSSNIGILACIFFPKCFIILIRPDLNTKNMLLRHVH
ncbi:vomeronasal type-2 receptor 26-like [Mantella aurantiaca]